jgi:hypothetical protein
MLIFVAVSPSARAQDDRVFRALAPVEAEKLLRGLKIDFKKSSSKKGDQQFFDFQRQNYRIRLTQFSPQDLLLDCVFRSLPIDKVNEWNTMTKLSRASVHKDASGDFTLLEYGLDLSGGATDGTIKQYIARFEDELKKYDEFIAANSLDDVILAAVTDAKIENILKTLGLNYQKKTNSAGIVLFDFEVNQFKLRMYNFGGKDLMMDVHFRKIPLEGVNGYNLKKKFIRVVNYKSKETEYTALETNFDCEAGVSEGMIRHWIMSFGEDVGNFSDYAKKERGEEKKK